MLYQTDLYGNLMNAPPSLWVCSHRRRLPFTAVGSAEQIVLNPADGYIADFVRDIDPGRVVRVGSIMHPARDVAGGFELMS